MEKLLFPGDPPKKNRRRMIHMLAITELTLRKMKEPAFFLMLLIVLLLSCMVSDLDPVSAQASSDSILAQLVSDQGGYGILTGSCFAFAISVILASFSGAAEIPRDISSGLIFLLLSKPLQRWRYLLGKYFGVIIMCVIFFTLSEIVIYLAHYFGTGQWYSPGLMFRQFQLLLAFFPFVAVIITFSCFMGDLAALIFAVIYLVFSLFFACYPIVVAMLPANFAAEAESAVGFFYYFFPNYLFYFTNFNGIGLVAFALTVYSLSIAAIFLSIAALRLEHMDFMPSRR